MDKDEAMARLQEKLNLEGRVDDWIYERVAFAIDRRQGLGGADLTWSKRMPEGVPSDELYVVDGEGNEYELEIDVTLRRMQ